MKISTTKKIKNTDDLIILCTKKNISKNGFTNDKENKYLQKMVSAGNKIININQYERQLFFIISENKDRAFNRYEKLRMAGCSLSSNLESRNIKTPLIVNRLKDEKSPVYFAEGLALASYRFEKYLSKGNKKKYTLKKIRLFQGRNDDIEYLKSIISPVFFARDLVNEPVSFLNSIQMAKELKTMAGEVNIKVKVLNKKEIEKEGMGGILAVNQASKIPPTFTILEWKPAKHVNKKPIVLVGKGLVYDTGGLSLKSTAGSMDEMKSDMGGAAAVAGAIYAAALAKLPLHIITLVPSTDNRPGGNAYAPGDIIEMHDGSTVEIMNTDAEGRLILADALSYAKRYDPVLVIDAATLTGAAAMAIGHFGIVGMGNASGKIFDKLETSGRNVYERVVRFPFWDEFSALMKSDIADQKNIGGRVAGAITAGKFLERFTDYPYIHLDIAGPAFLTSKDSYRGKGGTGYGVRLLFDFLRNY